MIAAQVLIDKLNGMRKDDIERLMLAEGMAGYQNDEHMCVLANWIRKESGVWVGVGVWRANEEGRGIGFGVCDSSSYDSDDYSSWVPMSVECQVFVGNFDQGYYPELVSPCEDYE